MPITSLLSCPKHTTAKLSSNAKPADQVLQYSATDKVSIKTYTLLYCMPVFAAYCALRRGEQCRIECCMRQVQHAARQLEMYRLLESSETSSVMRTDAVVPCALYGSPYTAHRGSCKMLSLNGGNVNSAITTNHRTANTASRTASEGTAPAKTLAVDHCAQALAHCQFPS